MFLIFYLSFSDLSCLILRGICSGSCFLLVPHVVYTPTWSRAWFLVSSSCRVSAKCFCYLTNMGYYLTSASLFSRFGGSIAHSIALNVLIDDYDQGFGLCGKVQATLPAHPGMSPNS